MKTKQPIKPKGKHIKTEHKSRTTLCLPNAMLALIHQTMDRENFSRKRRSQWIEMTLTHLFQLDEYESLILEEFLEPGANITIPLSLTDRLSQRIDGTIKHINQTVDLSIERSAVIRTAITQYLVRQSGK